MNRFKHVHHSSRYDKPVDSLHRVIKNTIKDASIITFTEVDSEKREKVLRGFPSWAALTGDKTGRDDCGIMWHDDQWAVVHKETYSVSEYMGGRIAAANVVLKHVDTGKRIVVSVIHLPSSVEGNGRVSGTRARVWFVARRRWVRRVKALRKRYNADAMLVVADWNIDWKRPWVSALIGTLMPKWKPAWKYTPNGGTHGNRLIDFSLFKGDLKVFRHPVIHQLTNASDHRPYSEVFAFTDL